jgi:hypothetical protein
MDHSAFLQILVADLSQFVPRHNPVEIGFFLFFPSLRRPDSVGCQSKGAHGFIGRGVPQFRISGQPAD